MKNPKKGPPVKTETSLPEDPIAALCEELTLLAHTVSESRESGRPSAEELQRRLLTLRNALANLEREQEPGRGELAALYGVSQAIGSSLDLSEVLNEVMDHIIRLTGAERSFLMLIDPESGELEFRAARNMDRETIASSAFEISRSIVKQVAATGEPIVTTNAQMDPRFKAQQSVIGYNLRSILCVPLKVRGQTTGVIYADNRIRAGLFNDRDRDLLTTFAGQAAVAIENARLFESVASTKSLMNNVFSSITSGVITLDPEGRVTFYNQAAEGLLHLPARPGRLADAVPPLADALRPLIERLHARGNPVVGSEIELTLPERGLATLRVSLSPLKDADGQTQGIAIVLDDLTEQRRLESRYRLFQRYLSPAVIERLPNDPTELRLGGQRQEITSLFADIRGFTDFSQQHDPETLVEVLNRYLDIGAKAVLAEDGTLDKFMGDAVVAFFNAPLIQRDHVMRAARAALKIQEGTARLHQQIPSPYRLGYGIGIALGEAVVGNVGTAQRLDYTAIGTCVNLARRLQESAAPGQILLAHAAYERIRNLVRARPLHPIHIESIGEVTAYELLGLL